MHTAQQGRLARAAPISDQVLKRTGAKHSRMIETVCAFANSEGGLLAIGVEDAKQMKPGAKAESRWFGIEENAEAFDDFRRQVMARFSPAIDRLHWMRLPRI